MLVNEGLCKDPICKEGRARWYPPERNDDKDALPKLMVHNSITDDIDPFLPVNKRTVSWYNCGPTVYDACHMGHARAYLTFDILRRIMEDYFDYNILYQVNITDVDDKIILRARQNKLIEEYTEEARGGSKSIDDVKAYVNKAMLAMKEKLSKKVEELSEPLPNDATTKEVEAHEKFLEEAKFKLEEFQSTEATVTSLMEKDNVEITGLITASRDALAAQLDKERGATVTDSKIFEDHARKYEREFFEDMEKLGVREPDVVTRVTEYVPQIVQYIEKIISNGSGYESNGSVYFDTNAFKQQGHDYRKLKPGVDTSAEEMAEGEGALTGSGSEKKHPNDFALWKASKPGEPTWESPWGPGRPGWHIECSVMASDILGSNLDIHGGGVDLMFPHHDNEMAQSEAYHNCAQWVNYFFHAGHLHIKGLKMSKSLKNFITIRQALQEHSPRQIRMMFLMQPWDKPMNYSDQTVDDAKSKEKYFKNFFGAVKAVLRTDSGGPRGQSVGWTSADESLFDNLVQAEDKVRKSLLDNFKTYDAIQTLVDLVQECNKYLAEQTKPNKFVMNKIAVYVTKMLRVFGLVHSSNNDDIGFGDTTSGSVSKEAILGPYVDAFVDFRVKVRAAAKEKDCKGEFLTICDDVRDTTLADLGIRVKDSGDVSTWQVDDPDVLKKEREEKKRMEAEKAIQKLTNKIGQKQKDLEKAQKAKINPTEMFRLGSHENKWGSYDDNGVPLTTKEGEPVSKSQQKANTKEKKAHEKAHASLLKSAGDKGIESYIAELMEEIKKLESELSQLQQ